MGARKRLKAEERKETKKSQYVAVLNNCPTSPNKMRLVADLVRGKDVYKALNILKFNPKHSSKKLEKLLLSAINNFEQKTGQRPEESRLYVKTLFVDNALVMKRLRTAPQGRGYRVRKRSNHVTLEVAVRPERKQKTEETTN